MFIQTQQLVKQMVIDKVVPGVSFALITGHKVTTNYLGQQQWLPSRKDLQPNWYYDLASLTKVMTTTLMILKLIEQQKLSLTTPIQAYLPAFQDHRVQIWHLLTHTSGISGYIPHRNQLSASKLKHALLHLEVGPNFERRMKYTDIGLIYLGFIIEAIYRQPVQTVLTHEILEPLNLTHTTFQPPKALCIPTVYENGQLLQGIVHDPKARILGVHCASAGLFSTLADVTQFAQYMLGQYVPKSAPVSQPTLQKLFTSFTGLPKQPRSLGWDLRWSFRQPHGILFHTGFTGTFILIDGQYQNALVILSNRIHPRAKNDEFLRRREEIIEAFCTETRYSD